MLTMWILFLVASGQIFFIGVACLLMGLMLRRLHPRRGVHALRRSLSWISLLFIGVGAPPWPWTIYLLLGVITVLWLVGETRRTGWAGSLRVLMVTAWVVAGFVEARYQVVPTLPLLGRSTVGVVGDSLSARMGDSDSLLWPERLAKSHGIIIRNHAVAGAKVHSAAGQVKQCSPDETLILLEIGGNDLLGGTDTESFAADLTQLIRNTLRPRRTVVMLELPMIPGLNQYGLIQRTIAAEYNVILIPKRILAGVLFSEGATVDSVHLSPVGHDRMAVAIWGVIRSAHRD